MADERIVFENLIEYTTRGEGDVLSGAGKIDAELDKLRKGAEVGISLDVTNRSVLSELDALDSAKYTPVIDPSINDKPIKDLNELDSAKYTPKVDVQETAGSQEVLSKLNDLRNLQAIEIAMNITGGVQSFIDTFGRIGGFSGVLELDTALATIQAKTGAMIPDAEHLILDLYQNGFGESRQQIADVITEASNLNIEMDDLEDATRAAFDVMNVTGYDSQETLRTLDSLVKNGLADSFQEAADIMVAGFQNGADRGQDLLDTFNEYGSTFSKLRIDGETALNLINTGLEAGIDNSDRVADAMREIGIRMGEIGENDAITQAFADLDKLSEVDLTGLLNAYQAGEITGDEYFEGFFTALDDATQADPEAAARIATNLIGTQAEDFGVETFAGLAAAFDVSMVDIEGRASTASNALSNTLGGQFEELQRTIEVTAQNFLSTEQIDLPGKVAAIKAAITDAVNVLQSGGTLGEALEVGFQIKGVDEFLGNFQRIVGNLVIAILEFIGSLQTGEAKQQTQATVARMAEGQLAFDVKLANPDEMAGLVQQALNRGVDSAAIGDALDTAVGELVSDGQIAKAQELLATAQEIAGTVQLAPGADPWGVEIIGNGVYTLAQAVKDYKEGTLSLEQIQPLIDQGKIVSLEIDTAAIQAEVDEAATAAKEQFQTALAGGDIGLAASVAESLNDPELLSSALNAAIEAGDVDLTSKLVADLSENTAVLQEAFNSAIAGGDLATAETIANQLGTEDLLAEVEVLKEVLADTQMNTTGAAATVSKDVGDMSAAVVESMDAAAVAAEGFDARHHNAMVGNTVTEDMAAVKAAAVANLPVVGQKFTELKDKAVENLSIVKSWAEITIGALMGFGNVAAVLDAVAAKLQSLAAAATVANNVINATSAAAASSAAKPAGTAPASAPAALSPFAALTAAAASNIVNSSSEQVININNSFIVQSQAQAASAAQQTANNLRGYR